LQAIATLLRHAKLSTAQIYTRVSVGRMMDTYNKAHPHAVRVWNQTDGANRYGVLLLGTIEGKGGTREETSPFFSSVDKHQRPA